MRAAGVKRKGLKMDYYDTIMTQRGCAEALSLLADSCRGKDKAIEILQKEITRLQRKGLRLKIRRVKGKPNPILY
jgi:hypothetical protein